MSGQSQEFDLSDIGPCAREDDEDDSYDGWVQKAQRVMQSKFKSAYRSTTDTLGGWEASFECGPSVPTAEMEDAIYEATGVRPRTRVQYNNPDSNNPAEVKMFVNSRQLQSQWTRPSGWLLLLLVLVVAAGWYYYRPGVPVVEELL